MSQIHNSLVSVFSEVQDFRNPSGKRYLLNTILLFICVATLCGYKGYRAMAEWSVSYPNMIKPLGFNRRFPSATTLYRVLKRLDLEMLISLFNKWVLNYFTTPPCFAIDGKCMRGAKKQGNIKNIILQAVEQESGWVVTQVSINEKTNEIPYLPKLLEYFPEKSILTMDALHTQENTAKKIVESGKDYIMIVKKNQRNLYNFFEKNFSSLCDLDVNQYQSLEKGHGRVEIRKLNSTTNMNLWLSWPGKQQCFRIERERLDLKSNTQTSELVYGITSLSPEQADASRLLTIVRNHWSVENKSHYVKDMTYDEDRSRVREGQVPSVMSFFRGIAIGLLRQQGYANIAKGCRYYAADPMRVCREILKRE